MILKSNEKYIIIVIIFNLNQVKNNSRNAVKERESQKPVTCNRIQETSLKIRQAQVFSGHISHIISSY